MRHEPMFDALEPRKLLSTFHQMSFEAFFGEHTPDVPFVRRIEGATSDGGYVWSERGMWEDGWIRTPDGSVLMRADVPKLNSADVITINDNGIVLAQNTRSGSIRTHEFFLLNLAGGGRDFFLEDATINGPAPSGGFLSGGFLKPILTESGHVFLNNRGRHQGESWVYHDGELTFLWRGAVIDAASDGTAIGSDINGPLMWSPTNGVSALAIGGVRINDHHLVFGSTGPRETGVLDLNTGEITVVRTNIGDTGASGGLAFLSNSGEIETEAIIPSSEGGGFARWFFELDRMEPSRVRITGAHTSSAVVALDDTGRLYLSTGVLRRVSARNEARADLDTTPQVFQIGDRTVAAVIDRFGDLRLLDAEGGNVDLGAFAEPFGGNTVLDAVGVIDPADGSLLVLVTDGSESTLFRGDAGDLSLTRVGITGATRFPITSQLTGFITEDGRVVFAGMNFRDELVLYFDNAPQEERRSIEGFAGLSGEHLAPQGIATPDFQGRLVSYSTSWGGQNIAGLNADGEIEVVWWAPGLDLWRADNLSEIAGAPRFVGNITATATPWGAVQIAGTTQDGEVHVVWWAPGLDTWRSDSLTAITGGPAVASGSLSSVVTPWGGISISARELDSGRAMFYWWTAQTGWVAEIVETRQNATDPVGSLALDIDGDTFSLIGVTSRGDVVRYSWMPEFGQTWEFENLSAMSAV